MLGMMSRRHKEPNTPETCRFLDDPRSALDFGAKAATEFVSNTEVVAECKSVVAICPGRYSDLLTRICHVDSQFSISTNAAAPEFAQAWLSSQQMN